MPEVQHPQAFLAPSEVVILGLLQVPRGEGGRAIYRQLRPLFLRSPERTRLFRLKF